MTNHLCRSTQRSVSPEEVNRRRYTKNESPLTRYHVVQLQRRVTVNDSRIGCFGAEELESHATATPAASMHDRTTSTSADCFRQSVGAAVVKHARWLMFQPVTILLFSNWHFPSFLFGICFTRVERNPHNVSMTTVVVDRTGILSNVSIRLRVTCLSQVKSLGSAFADHNRACAELNSGGASFPWVGRPREGGKTCVKGATLFRTLTPPPFLIFVTFRVSSNIRTYWVWVTTF